MAIAEWSFIDHRASQDAATRKLVRATVARNYRRKERLRNMQNYVQRRTRSERSTSYSQSSDKGGNDNDTARTSIDIHERCCGHAEAFSFSNNEEGEEADEEIILDAPLHKDHDPSPWKPVSVRVLASGYVNPLATGSPIRAYEDEHCQLVQHFISVLAPFYYPFGSDISRAGLKEALLSPESLSDAVLYRSILFSASAHQDFISGGGQSQVTLKHKGETIRLINDSLRCDVDDVGDQTVLAMAMLAATLNMTGDDDEQLMHLTALKKIVKMRGGVNGITMQKVLHMFITWQDFMCSSLTAARFAQAHCNAYLHAPSFLSERTANGEIEDKLAGMPLPADLRDILLPIFRDLHILADMLPKLWCNIGTFDTKYMVFTHMRSALDHHALGLITDPAHLFTSYNSTLVSCCMATLAFTHVTLRDFHPTCAALSNGKKILFDRFDSFEDGPYMAPEDNRNILSLRLWALIHSAAVAINEYETEWFAARVLHLMECLGLHTPRDVEAELSKYIWTPSNSTTFQNYTWSDLLHASPPP